jgi:hypothetical protein
MNAEEERQYISEITEELEQSGFQNIQVTRVAFPENLVQASLTAAKEEAQNCGATIEPEEIPEILAHLRSLPYFQITTEEGYFSIFFKDCGWLYLADTGFLPKDLMSKEAMKDFGYTPSAPSVVPIIDWSVADLLHELLLKRQLSTN